MSLNNILNLWGNNDRTNNKIYQYDSVSCVKSSSGSIFTSFRNIFSRIFNNTEIGQQFVPPKIVMIGGQSTGKSAILTSILGIKFSPSDDRRCTMVPLCIKSKNTPNNTKSIHRINGTIIKAKDIHDKLLEIFDKYSDICDEMITIEMEGPEFINFEFIDLPGLVTYPEATKQKTKELCMKYMDKNNIILCTIPCTEAHLHSSISLALIQECGMEKNTILVFTMADKVQRENVGKDIVARVIKNNNELDIGKFLKYYVIINPQHNDSRSLSEVTTFANGWFEEHIINILPDEFEEKSTIINSLGRDRLLEGLELHYGTHIQKKWIPNTKSMLLANIEENTALLETLGIDPVKINVKEIETMYTNHIINKYIEQLNNIKINIKYSNTYDFKKYFEQLVESVKNININYSHIWINRNIDSEEFNNNVELQKYQKMYVPSRFSTINYNIQEVLTTIFKEKLLHTIKFQKGIIMAHIIEKVNKMCINNEKPTENDKKTEEQTAEEKKAYIDVEFDYTQILKCCIFEMEKMTFEEYKFFDMIEESKAYQKQRVEYTYLINENKEAYSKLEKMDVDLENSNSMCDIDNTQYFDTDTSEDNEEETKQVEEPTTKTTNKLEIKMSRKESKTKTVQ